MLDNLKCPTPSAGAQAAMARDPAMLEYMTQLQTSLSKAVEVIGKLAKSKAQEEGHCCGSCAIGGTCDSECPGAPPLQMLPECYKGCTTISRCLYKFYEEARLRTDSAAWLEYNKREIALVHINQSIGNAPNYSNVIPPVVANTNYMLMQEPAQWLPYEPGFFKIDMTWTGPQALQQVTVRIWTGDYSVQSVTTTPDAAGLIQIGRDFTLNDFFVSADAGGGCCYFLEYPTLFGCEEPAIPNQRRVFFEIRAGALGDSQITSFAVAIVKRHTKGFIGMCKRYGLEF